MNNVYDCTNELETKLAEYTGAPYAVCLDNCSNAIFLSLMYEGVKGKLKLKYLIERIHQFPAKLFMLVLKLNGKKVKGKTITGAYNLGEELKYGMQH